MHVSCLSISHQQVVEVRSNGMVSTRKINRRYLLKSSGEWKFLLRWPGSLSFWSAGKDQYEINLQLLLTNVQLILFFFQFRYMLFNVYKILGKIATWLDFYSQTLFLQALGLFFFLFPPWTRNQQYISTFVLFFSGFLSLKVWSLL